jgi:polyvinyl alcohol dehydrogenase (cytochrome)
MKRFSFRVTLPMAALLSVSAALCSAPVAAQDAGEAIWKEQCVLCHEGGDERAPTRAALREFPPESMILSLTSGVMRYQGLRLTATQRREVADFLSDIDFSVDLESMMQGRCESSPPLTDPFAGPHWSGWGPTIEATHFQPADQARLAADDVPKLKLRWAFGFPDSSSAWSQPTVGAGRIWVGSQAGSVYSLDARTGCVYWQVDMESGVRSAISIGKRRGTEGWAIYFGDMRGSAYALDAATGEKLWEVQLSDHPFARITGSPVLHEDVLYVPVSSWEESQGARPDYGCCTFRGSVAALDAQTGAIRWQSYTIPEEPKERGVSSQGKTLYGPSGGAIWSAPTVDPKRGLVYAGVGNTYSGPAHANTDAVVAFDMESGAIRWSKQTTPGDTFVIGCGRGGPNPNCPEEVGPDLDFGTSPIIARTPAGRDLIVIGQKSGVAWAMDPDKQGEIVWQYRAGEGGALGGIEWGTAVDSRYAYIPISDLGRSNPGGLHAVNLENGERVWFAPPAEPICPGRGCSPAQSAAITVIPGVVFSGALDGGFRAFNAENGEIIWQVDTNPEVATVNGVSAHGGSLIGPGPTVVDGMVFVNSGYGSLGGRPGNVLLAYGVD